jgi:hypothetical protein
MNTPTPNKVYLKTSFLEALLIALKCWAKFGVLPILGDFAELGSFAEFRFFVADRVSDDFLNLLQKL